MRCERVCFHPAPMKRSRTWMWVAAAVVIGLVVAWFVTGDGPTPEVLREVEAAGVDAGAPAGGRAAVAPVKTAAKPGDAGVPEAKTGPGQELARFGWGSGEGQLGRSAANESNPEAPMSLTVDALGQTWILDQVNGRLVKLDRQGKVVATTPIAVQAAQDVAVTADGKALVLDRLVDKEISVIGPDGKPAGSLPIEGKGLEEGGASTGVFADGDDVYVEREHGDSVRIGSTSGQADAERLEVPGRPAQDNKSFLTANIVDPQSGVVLVTAVERSGAHRFTRQLPLGVPVVALNALDADRSGIIYLGAVVQPPQQSDFAVMVVCLDPLDGRPVGATQFPANTGPEETFREVTVLPEGGVLFLERTEQGARVVRYSCT